MKKHKIQRNWGKTIRNDLEICKLNYKKWEDMIHVANLHLVSTQDVDNVVKVIYDHGHRIFSKPFKVL